MLSSSSSSFFPKFHQPEQALHLREVRATLIAVNFTTVWSTYLISPGGAVSKSILNELSLGAQTHSLHPWTPEKGCRGRRKTESPPLSPGHEKWFQKKKLFRRTRRACPPLTKVIPFSLRANGQDVSSSFLSYDWKVLTRCRRPTASPDARYPAGVLITCPVQWSKWFFRVNKLVTLVFCKRYREEKKKTWSVDQQHPFPTRNRTVEMTLERTLHKRTSIWGLTFRRMQHIRGRS